MKELPLTNLIKNSLMYGLGQVLGRFTSFLLLPVFTAYLSPADFGILAILAIMNLIVTALFSFGSGAATGLCYFEGNDLRRKEETLWTSAVMLVGSAVVIGMIAFFCSCQLSQLLFGTPDRARVTTVSLLGGGAALLNAHFLLYLMFEKRALLYVAFTTVVTMLTLGLSVLTVVFLKRGVDGMVESILVANVFVLTLLLFYSARSLPFRLSRRVAYELLRLGIPLIPSSFFLFILQQGNQYILQRFRGLEEIGVYIIGFNLGLVMNLLVSAFSSAWYPHFMSYMDRQEEAKDHFGRIITGYILGFGILSLLFYAVARPVIMIMTQPAFHEAYKIIGPVSTAFLFGGFFTLMLPAVYFSREVKYVPLIQGGAALIALVFDFLLIPWAGMMGAALALVLGYFTLLSLQFTWNRGRQGKYFQVPYEWKRIWRFGFLYTGIAVLTLWPRQLPISSEIAFSGLILLCLPAVLYLSLTRGERQFLSSVVH